MSGAGDEKRYWNGTEMGSLALRVTRAGSDQSARAVRPAPPVLLAPPALLVLPAQLGRAA